MATHDYVIANQSGAAFRTDLNNALAAIVSNNSNSSSPSTTYAYQWWADTSANILKLRNSANNAWISICNLDGTITADRVVTASIADDAITQALIAANAVGSTEIAANAVGASELADNAVDTAAVVDEAITQAKLNFPIAGPNLIINGAMQIAQRGTSLSTDGYLIDRFFVESFGEDETPTQSQVDIASGTTAYQKGFRKALRITNGNQTSGAGTSDLVTVNYSIEAQDIANSGWNYTDTNSFLTLCFYIKSSVAQNFFGRLLSLDGTKQGFAFETGSLSADTWTKVTVPIAGNSNLTFDNNNASGLTIEICGFRGTSFTGSMALNTWGAFNSNKRTPDQTSTWYTTNNATLEITGLQLVLGSVATEFQHRSISEELTLCQRYFEIAEGGWTGPVYATDSNMTVSVPFKVTKRANPTLTKISSNENSCSSVSVVANSIDQTLGARVQGNNVFNDGSDRFFNAKFSADSEL